MGINSRNADYTLRYNKRHLYPLVDNKIATKELALKASISVPELYAVLSIAHQVRELRSMLSKLNDFVVKPACGSGGQGIVVISRNNGDSFETVAGKKVGLEELEHHVLNTMGGLFSLGGQPDKVMLEYRVKSDSVFDEISWRGVPDIRIIVFLGVPVMAMLRLPTRLSSGRANLHQGAIGVGVGISDGLSVNAVCGNRVVDKHPDTAVSVVGRTVPYWQEMLSIAARCYELTSLGYLGVDIVLDSQKGPMLLEINARPGLNIQIANQKGILPRLKLVEKNADTLCSVEQRVCFAREAFL